MARAQRRDAVHTQKFYFRKNVFAPGTMSPISTPASSGTSSPIEPNLNGIPFKKERKMRNCFPPPMKPESWEPEGSIEDEYEEYTLEEIINGKVRLSIFFLRAI